MNQERLSESTNLDSIADSMLADAKKFSIGLRRDHLSQNHLSQVRERLQERKKKVSQEEAVFYAITVLALSALL